MNEEIEDFIQIVAEVRDAFGSFNLKLMEQYIKKNYVRRETYEHLHHLYEKLKTDIEQRVIELERENKQREKQR